MKYRKKPVVIDAFRLGDEWPDWWADKVYGAEARKWEALVWPAKRELMKFWSRFGANL